MDPEDAVYLKKYPVVPVVLVSQQPGRSTKEILKTIQQLPNLFRIDPVIRQTKTSTSPAEPSSMTGQEKRARLEYFKSLYAIFGVDLLTFLSVFHFS